MKMVRLILTAALAGSAFVGFGILSTDFWLWSAAPSHAYGLIIFVVLDVVLIIGTWRGIRLSRFGTLLTAALQLVAMLGDVVAGQPAGTPAAAFRSYLLADIPYLGLLIIQSLIIVIAIGSWALTHLQAQWLAALKTVKS
jgi:hypothetical protein